MTLRNQTAGFKPVRRDELFGARVHDSYKLTHKLSEPTVCPDCGAVYHAGRWHWGERPDGASEVMCAACHRIHDKLPAGYVHIGGAFFEAHRDELLALVHHHEQKARSEHPMERIIGMEDEGKGVLVTTTGIHLARDLGCALDDAYQGKLEFHYNQDEQLLRVHWQR